MSYIYHPYWILILYVSYLYDLTYLTQHEICMNWIKYKDLNFKCECVECGTQANTKDLLNVQMLSEHA